MPLPSLPVSKVLYVYVHPVGLMWGVKADVAILYCTNKEQIFEGASRILTLLEIWWLGCGLFDCFKVYRKCTLLQKREGIQSVYVAGYGLNIQVACTPSMNDDI
jgi:hypothetical protein